MTETRRTYTKEFKESAVELLTSSEKTAVEISRDLGIRTELLYRWKSDYQTNRIKAFPGSGHQNLSETEIDLKRLRREKRELEEEREILKKPWPFSTKYPNEVPIYPDVQLRSLCSENVPYIKR